MLYFQRSITVDPYTLKTNPKVAELELIRGTLKRLIVGFPSGCCGYVGVKVHLSSVQICPFTLGEWLSWNAYVFDLPTDYPLNEEPYTLYVHVYNEDDTYYHTVFVGAWVEVEAKLNADELLDYVT
jgi:hypothetical protein